MISPFHILKNQQELPWRNAVTAAGFGLGPGSSFNWTGALKELWLIKIIL
jgi:hypothetical protein